MNILLAYISGVPDRTDPYVTLLPTGLCYLHSSLKEAGFDSLLVNFSAWSEAEIARQLAMVQPDVAAISQWTHNRHASQELARLVRRSFPECLIIMGGGHATFEYAEILQAASPVDLVALGESEATLLELAGHLSVGDRWHEIPGIAFRRNGQVIVTPPRVPRENLDQLPFAALHLEDSVGVDCGLQAEFIVTARGCPSACTFCSSPGFWNRRVRFRSPENIVKEILFIRDTYGLIYFSLRDDTFTADRSRAIDFCRLLIERNIHIIWNCQSRVTALDDELLVWMKRAGCECVQLGVESGSPRILSLLGKSITPRQVELAAAAVRKVGINLSVYLISDVPGETEEDVAASIDLIRCIRPDDGYVSPLAYYPGTQQFADAVAAGMVDEKIFVLSRDAAVYAATKPGRNSSRLLKALSRNQPDKADSFAEQKRLLGYCSVTNVLAGEWFRQAGNSSAAEREFREITVQEPGNPWGWYLLGELCAERGKQAPALRCYHRVLELVPKHAPSLAAAAIMTDKGSNFRKSC
jgi:anaerobic magnesium-protoporphyrin IX monomethyl ester cyclase